MNIYIVLAHPEPKSLNAAPAHSAATRLCELGHGVRLADLYAEGFNPVAGRDDFTTRVDSTAFRLQAEQRYAAERRSFSSEIVAHQDSLIWCDALILQFPLWWQSVPAILKGWFDRMLAAGVFYGHVGWFETARLYGRRALLSLTVGGQEDRWGQDRLFGSMEAILQPYLLGTLNFCGFANMPPHIVYGAPRMTYPGDLVLDNRRDWIDGLFVDAALPMRRAAEFMDPRHRDQ